MKCRSVACLWPTKPPSHRITAAAVLNHPPTLYTGGSDGSIIWWSLSTSDSNSEVKPVAMLCGHAARIADLAICHPVVSLDDKRTENSSDDATSSVSGSSGALFSACLDGVLCVWSRGSGHCRRRRKLPPWVGSPSIIRTLPTSSRYVCICSVDAAHTSPDHSTDAVQGSLPPVDEGVHHNKPSKCTVVVVDSYSLTIVQTVFHGVLSIGQLKFMDIVLSGEDRETHSVLMADSSGRVQLAPILKDSPPDSKQESALDKNFLSEVAISGNGLGEGGEVVSVATHGNIVALLLQNCCLFRLMTNNVTIGQISFVDQLLLTEGNHIHSLVLGGMFLNSTDPGLQFNQESFLKNFIVWNSAGLAIVYLVSYLDDIFKCEPLCNIPCASHAVDTKLMISFIQLKDHLIRFESVCFNVEEPLHWKPQFTVWSLCDKQDEGARWSQNCQKCGESDPFTGWISGSSSLFELNGCDGRRTPKKISPGSSPSFKPGKELKDKQRDSFAHEGQTVCSSMVISENLLVPYAIVYGYFSGEIEVVRFDMLPAHDLHCEEPNLHHDPDLVKMQKIIGLVSAHISLLLLTSLRFCSCFC